MSRTSPNRIVIAGVGLISPIGHSAWQTFRALLDGITLTDRADQLAETINPIDLVRAVGSVSIVQHGATDPVVELAERAAREALREAEVEPLGLPVMFGNSKGAVYALACAQAKCGHVRLGQLLATPVEPRPPDDAHLAVALGPHAYVAHHLAKRLGLAPVRCVVAACASSLAALHQARIMMTDPLGRDAPQHMLVVTSEAPLLPALIHSYARLGVLPPLKRDQYRAKPLDVHRCGFTVSQIGAAVVLKAVERPQSGQIELVDTAVATEAYDLVRPSPCMSALQHVAGRMLRNRTIDVLHPHATGTFENDADELNVYANVLARRDGVDRTGAPDIYAVKGALGHGLGAAGLVSVVISSLCAKANRRPPMPWLDVPIQSSGGHRLQPSRNSDSSSSRLATHAIFASGFAGHVAGAVIRKT